jgi:Skp family chaperone for outer membrane proteins
MRRAELEQYAADRAKALQESARKERKKVIEEIRAEIRRRAAIEGYALVLDLSALSTNETNVVLYSIDTLDITDKVLTELNRSAKAPAAQQ